MKRIVVSAFLIGMVAGWNVTNVGAIAPVVADDYGIDLASVGLFPTALFATHLALQIPGGRASDRWGAKSVGLAGLLVISAGAAISMIAPELWVGLAGRAVTGVGTGLAFVAGVDYVRATGGSSFMQGLFGGMSLGAGGLAIAIVPQLVGSLGWRASYWSVLAIAVVGTAVLAVAPSGHLRRRA